MLDSKARRLLTECAASKACAASPSGSRTGFDRGLPQHHQHWVEIDDGESCCYVRIRQRGHASGRRMRSLPTSEVAHVLTGDDVEYSILSERFQD